MQGRDHRGAVTHRSGLDPLGEIVGNEPPRVRLHRQTLPQPGGIDVDPWAGLQVPRPLRIVRPAPAVLVVLPIPQRVVGLLPARRRDVQALAALQITARRQYMHMHALPLAVLDRRPAVAVLFQPRPGGLLELVQHLSNLLITRLVLRRPGDQPRGVAVLELQRVGHRRHLLRVAPQDRDLLSPLPRPVGLAGQVVGRRRRRAAAARQELNHHRGGSAPSAPPDRDRSRPDAR